MDLKTVLPVFPSVLGRHPTVALRLPVSPMGKFGDVTGDKA